MCRHARFRSPTRLDRMRVDALLALMRVDAKLRRHRSNAGNCAGFGGGLAVASCGAGDGGPGSRSEGRIGGGWVPSSDWWATGSSVVSTLSSMDCGPCATSCEGCSGAAAIGARSIMTAGGGPSGAASVGRQFRASQASAPCAAVTTQAAAIQRRAGGGRRELPHCGLGSHTVRLVIEFELAIKLALVIDLGSAGALPPDGLAARDERRDSYSRAIYIEMS
jgi:hypothetical protein